MSEAVGGCRCGAIRYRLDRAPIFVNCCHCRDCQSLSGSAFAINIMTEADAVAVTAGKPMTDGEGVIRCEACATALWATHPRFGPTIRFVRAGTLDAAERIVPNAHFFVRSKHPWIVLPESVRAFDVLPGPDDPPLFDAATRARVDAAMAGDGTHLAGRRSRG